MAKFILTRERREIREMNRLANRESFLASVRESANVRKSMPEHDTFVSGSTRHKASVRCVDVSANDAPPTRIRCKQTIKGQYRD